MEAIYDRSNGRVVSRHQMMRKYRFSVVMKHHYLALLIISALISCGTAHKAISIRTLTVDKLGVDVGVDENREYSYTDKKAGFGMAVRIRIVPRTGMPDGIRRSAVSYQTIR